MGLKTEVRQSDTVSPDDIKQLKDITDLPNVYKVFKKEKEASRLRFIVFRENEALLVNLDSGDFNYVDIAFAIKQDNWFSSAFFVSSQETIQLSLKGSREKANQPMSEKQKQDE